MKNFSRGLIACIGIGVLFAGCSTKDRTPVYNVSVQMPKSAQSSSATVSKSSSFGGASALISDIPVAAAAAGFRCFALNIVGTGINADPRFQCNDGSMGQMVGMADLAGGSVSADVMAGASRKIQLIGAKFSATSSIQGCPSFESILSASQNPDKTFDGVDAYNLGEVTTDIFSDVSVTITANFNSTIKLFDQCDSSGSSSQGQNLSLYFKSSYPANFIYQQSVLSGTANPGTFVVNGGKAPYHYSYAAYSFASNAFVTEGSLTSSADTITAIYHPIFNPTVNQVNVTVTDANGATASLQVPVSGVPTTGHVFSTFTAALGSCIPLQLAAVDAQGNPAYTSSAISVSGMLNAGSAGGDFFSDAACTNQVHTPYLSGLTIPASSVVGLFGSSTPVLYYKNTTAPELTVVTFSTNASASLILSGVPAHYFFQDQGGSLMPSIVQGACYPGFQLVLESAAGSQTNPHYTSDASARTVNLNSAQGNFSFYTDSSCTNAASSISLNAFQPSSGSYYLKTTGAVGTSVTLNAQDQTNLSGSMAMVVLSPGTATPTPYPSATPSGSAQAAVHATSASFLDYQTLTVYFDATVASSTTSIAMDFTVNSSNTAYPLAGPNSYNQGIAQTKLQWTSGQICPGDTITFNTHLTGGASDLSSVSISGVPTATPANLSDVEVLSNSGTDHPTFIATTSATDFSIGDTLIMYASTTCTAGSEVPYTDLPATVMSSAQTAYLLSSTNAPEPNTFIGGFRVKNACGQFSNCFPKTLSW